ncbi:MAG: polyphenol oxidase family protein [Candidatus Adiutricales bacterium]
MTLSHGIFTRYGRADSRDLNLALDNGCDKQEVSANINLVARTMGFERLILAGQIHGDRSLVVRADRKHELCRTSGLFKGYDALITRDSGLGMLITLADCQGVVLYDPRRRVLALVHNGWKGSAANILGKTVSRLVNEFKVKPGDILAGIGPSLGPCCAEFINYKQELPENFLEYHVGNRHFDFWAISENQLTEMGIRPENIEVSGVCTVCNDEFFSYRRDKNEQRFGLAAGLI